eukprot:CAMPEP_0114547846 /NCGR_PEP_ID=MMETSP0114-20121206/4673_1 /TAXON_ID=31324 /ORGANISM="Goniomonas sp, Strain m" /LENGTH=46 /DNA_ID= /DNA_START= /DNA_END= /DNA_ORIENTATION=
MRLQSGGSDPALGPSKTRLALGTNELMAKTPPRPAPSGGPLARFDA